MLTACRVFMAMTLAGQVVGQASSFLPDYSKGRLAAAYIFRMMNVEPNIDNFSTTGLHKVGVSFGSCVIGWGMPLGGDFTGGGGGCHWVRMSLGEGCHWVGMSLGAGCHWVGMSLGGECHWVGMSWEGSVIGWGYHWVGVSLGGDVIG